jgi:NADH-quinone oxidoreductase subunit H
LAEYVNIIAVSALATTLFLGGYRALPGLGFTELWLGGWFTMVWFFAKVLLFFFFFIWLRGTLPRLRYDQFMKFGWKVLIPASLVWIMVVATLRALSAEGASQSVIFAFTFGIVLLVLAGTSVYEKSKKSAEARAKDVGDMPEPSFPVPVMPSEKGIVRGE